MSDFAKIDICGRIGKIDFYEKGSKLTLYVAVNSFFKKNEEQQKETVWIPCVMWGSNALYYKDKVKMGDVVSAFGFVGDNVFDRDGEKRHQIFMKVMKINISSRKLVSDDE